MLTRFSIHDIQKISAIPLSVTSCRDKPFSKHTKTGQFTVKSAYATAVEKTRQPKRSQKTPVETSTSYAQEKSPMRKTLRALQMKHKLKHFIWRCLLQSIPVNEQIHKRTKAKNPICDYCGEAVETVQHMMFFCRNAEMIWKLAPITWEGLNDLKCNFLRW